jgi:hypothetical protein
MTKNLTDWAKVNIMLKPFSWMVKCFIDLVNIFWSKMKQHSLKYKPAGEELKEIRNHTTLLQEWFNAEVRILNEDVTKSFSHNLIVDTVDRITSLIQPICILMTD